MNRIERIIKTTAKEESVIIHKQILRDYKNVSGITRQFLRTREGEVIRISFKGTMRLKTRVKGWFRK